MSVPQEHRPVKLVASLFSNKAELINEGITRMMSFYGDADFVSAVESFNFTDYYQKEFGSSLRRRFASFRNLIPPEILPMIKLRTNDIENSLLDASGSRRLNIDPGYIAPQHFVLATCKGFSHRPYLGRGIYADLTLIFRHGHYHPLEWTYPDYASQETRGMMEKIRAKYMLQTKKETTDD